MSLDKFKIEKTAQNLIGHFDTKAKVTAENVEEIWRINIDSEETASMLIGRHGQTLQALEHILRLMLSQEAEEFLPLSLDISGYRASREREIAEEALESAKKVIETGEEEALPSMNSFERRIAHLALSDIEAVETESVGEEPYRKIIIRRMDK